MASGGSWKPGRAEAIVVRRVDILRVHDFARANSPLRDYLFIRLPFKIGLRTGELVTLRVEDIDFENRSFQVLDSKKHTEYPLPLDAVTLEYIKELVEPRREGYVFRRKGAWKVKAEGRPLTLMCVWRVVRTIAAEAGVEGFNPRMLRQFFAADWNRRGKNLEVLRRILRHSDLGVTQHYVSRLTFFEDVQREYDRLQQLPMIRRNGRNNEKLEMVESVEHLSRFYKKFCMKCVREPTCRYVDEAATCRWADGCRFFLPAKKVETVDV